MSLEIPHNQWPKTRQKWDFNSEILNNFMIINQITEVLKQSFEQKWFFVEIWVLMNNIFKLDINNLNLNFIFNYLIQDDILVFENTHRFVHWERRNWIGTKTLKLIEEILSEVAKKFNKRLIIRFSRVGHQEDTYCWLQKNWYQDWMRLMPNFDVYMPNFGEDYDLSSSNPIDEMYKEF